MCGKFTQLAGWGAQVRLEDLVATSGPSEAVTPMRFATVIRRDLGGRREAVRMRWGLVPPGARAPARAGFIHARAESIETRPAFRDAFFHRRGLLVVKSFNAGRKIAQRKTEQHVVNPDDGQPIALAVIWERFGEPHGGLLETFAMVTVPANRVIAPVSDRMPAVIGAEDWAKWLGEEPASVEVLKAMLVPFEAPFSIRREKPEPPRGPSDSGSQLRLL